MTLILFGVSLTYDVYPGWLGWVGILIGVATLIAATGEYLKPDPASFLIYGILASVLAQLWILALAAVMLRQSKALRPVGPGIGGRCASSDADRLRSALAATLLLTAVGRGQLCALRLRHDAAGGADRTAQAAAAAHALGRGVTPSHCWQEDARCGVVISHRAAASCTSAMAEEILHCRLVKIAGEERVRVGRRTPERDQIAVRPIKEANVG